jgi:hypothetical protein
MDFEDIRDLVQHDPQSVIEAIQREPSFALEEFCSDQRTLLHLAAGFGHEKLVKLLVDYGADVNAIDKYQETPLFRSIRFRKDDISMYLVEQMEDDEWIHYRDHKGQTVLHRACDMGSAAMVLHLLEKGLDPLARDEKNQTPLDVGLNGRFSRVADWKDEMIRRMEIEFGKQNAKEQ